MDKKISDSNNIYNKNNNETCMTVSKSQKTKKTFFLDANYDENQLEGCDFQDETDISTYFGK